LPWQRPLSDRNKDDEIGNLRPNTHQSKNLVKIGPIDPEIDLLKELLKRKKKKEINASRT